jgi:transketolase
MKRPLTLAMGQDESREDAKPVVEAPFGQALARIAEHMPTIVGLSADLAKYTDILPFAERFPDRFFNVGMAEQNLISMSAGMARTGCVAFCTTYGVFATRRAYDFLAIGCAHSRLNVKVFAGLPGLTTGYGGTHQAIEDLGLVRLIPGMTVIDPCDATEITQVTEAAAEFDGPLYVRLLRGKVPTILDPAKYQFQIGRAVQLRAGSDLGIVSTGFMTERALEAADHFATRGIQVGVLHVPTLKPLDDEAIAGFCAAVDHVMVAENHVSSGGLASQVVEVLYEAAVQRRIIRVGLPDKFIECGSVPSLQAKYGLTTDAMISRAEVALARV